MVTTQETPLATGEFQSDASDEMNSGGYGELNQGDDGTGAYGEGQSGEAASDEDGDLTEDTFDHELAKQRGYVLEAELRPVLDKELRKFHSSVQRNMAQVKREAREGQAALISHLREQLEAQGIDPEILKLDVLDAKQITTREQVRQRFAQGEQTWRQEEPAINSAFDQYLEEKGFNPATGQWVVEPNDPELTALKAKAIETAQMWTLTGQDDPQLEAQAKALGAQWRSLVVQKAKAKAGGSGTPQSQPRQQQQPRQQATALAAATKRGKVIAGRPGGGSAPVTFQDYLTQAAAENPKASKMDQYVRATELQIAARESLRK